MKIQLYQKFKLSKFLKSLNFLFHRTPEHAYSIMCKQMNPSTTTNDPLIQLSRSTQEFLEELMMEGDLLEVTLDETMHLWQILRSSCEHINELEMIYMKFNIPVSRKNLRLKCTHNNM